MSLIAADNLLHSYRSLQKFTWYIDVDFQWHALIYVLGELMVRPTGDDKDDAWPQVEDIFKNHPSLISDQKKPLHIAIANLCLKAWRAREKAQVENPQASTWLDTPPFILQLREQRTAQEARVHAKRYESSQLNPKSQAEDGNSTTQPQFADTSIILDISNDLQFDSFNALYSSSSPEFSVPMIDDMAMDWQGWDTLMNDFEVPTLLSDINYPPFQNMDSYGQQSY